MKQKKIEWWQPYFNENYIKTYVDIVTPALTRKQVKFLFDKLKIKKETKVLDLACGYGRHTIPLAKKGVDVVGFDYSQKFINLAKKQAKELKLNNIVFVQGDMRRLSYKNKFDFVINLFTSFGYFVSEEDNLVVLKNIAKALKLGGKLLIDLNNVASSLYRAAKKGRLNKKTGHLVFTKKDKISSGFLVVTKNELDLTNMRWYMTRTWKESGRNKSYTTDVRMFTLPEMRLLLKIAGFEIEKVWGDFDGKPFDINSRRLIILAGKK